MSNRSQIRWIVPFVAIWAIVGVAGFVVAGSGDESSPGVAAAPAADQGDEASHGDEAAHEEESSEHHDEASTHEEEGHHEEAVGHHHEASEHAEDAVTEDAQAVHVAGSEFAFDHSTIEVEANAPVAVSFENIGAAEHDWVLHTLDGEEVEGAHAHAMPGEEATAVFTPEAGRYEYWCTIPGHKEAGMAGVLFAK